MPPVDECTQTCPYCAETIKAEARKCRFCGEWLDDERTTIQEKAPPKAVIAEYDTPCPACGLTHQITVTKDRPLILVQCSGCDRSLIWDYSRNRLDISGPREIAHQNIRRQNAQAFWVVGTILGVIVLSLASIHYQDTHSQELFSHRAGQQTTEQPLTVPTLSSDQAAVITLDQHRQDAAQRDVTEFNDKMRSLPGYQDYYAGARLSGLDESHRTVQITVPNSWFSKPYQVRLQTAQRWQGIWADLRTPNDGDGAAVWIVDGNGNHVGGSTPGTGSLVTVND